MENSSSTAITLPKHQSLHLKPICSFLENTTTPSMPKCSGINYKTGIKTQGGTTIMRFFT